MTATAWPHIEVDAAGVPFVEGTRTKVLQLVLDHLAYAWDAEQLHRQHPQLSLPQIHAALGYYFENRDECDRLIAQQRQLADETYASVRNPQLEAKLRSIKQGS